MKLIRALQHDTFCRSATSLVWQRNYEFTLNKEGLLVCMAHIDGTVLVVRAPSLRQRVLAMSHYSPIAGHPGQRRMYDTVKRTFHWLYMATDVDYVVRNCKTCFRDNPKYHHRRHMQLFPVRGPFEFVAMKIVGSFSKTGQGNHCSLVFTDR